MQENVFDEENHYQNTIYYYCADYEKKCVTFICPIYRPNICGNKNLILLEIKRLLIPFSNNTLRPSS